MSILKKIVWLATLECFIVNLAQTNELDLYKTLINSENAHLHNPAIETKDINRVKVTSVNEVFGQQRQFVEELEIPEFMLNQPVYQLAKRNVTQRC